MNESSWAGDWVLATSNRGKLAEFRELLADTPLNLDCHRIPAAEAPEETGSSFVENALIKARHAAGASGRPAIADDSGLCVAALDGAPGVHSARFAGPDASDADNFRHLLALMQGLEGNQREAEFISVIVALRWPEDPAPIIATGRWAGLIAVTPAGANGFGYDPVFVVPELNKTAAQLTPSRKNALSHRGRACAELRRLLEQCASA